MARSVLPRGYFRDTATVYTRAANGQFTVVHEADLACRVDPIDLGGAPTGGARSELAARRAMQYPADYTLPTGSQVLAEGLRWNPINVNAPQPAVRDPITGAVEAYQVELVRAA